MNTHHVDSSNRPTRADTRPATKILAKFVALPLLLLLTLPCAAADHVVYVQDAFPPNHMSPNNLTIAVGDTVTFKSVGNNEFHNVHALNDSFRCSVGCRGDGSNTTGSPSRNDWSATVKFDRPGLVKYGCDAHPGTFSAPATINVVAASPSIVLGGYLSGNWYNPGQGGHGFQIEFTNSIDSASGKPIMLAVWFVYTPDGTGQNWIYAQGPYDAATGRVTLPAVLLGGARFPPNFNSADVRETTGAGHWGTLTFAFTDCNNGTASWHSDVAGYNAANDVPLSIARLTQIAGTSCPQ